jgi:hypothetical protein
VTHIRDFEVEGNGYKRIVNVETYRSGILDPEPRSLRYAHLVQLSLHDFGLVPHDGELGGEGRVPPFAGRAHLVQLLPEYNGTNECAKRDDGGQNDHPSVAAIYSIDESLLGYGWLAIGYLFVCASIWSIYRRRIMISIGFISGAVFLTIHAVNLILG